jgi:hypothetical protein
MTAAQTVRSAEFRNALALGFLCFICLASWLGAGLIPINPALRSAIEYPGLNRDLNGPAGQAAASRDPKEARVHL